MRGRRRPPSQTWRTFLENYLTQVMAADFFVVPTATWRLLFVLVILAHDRRSDTYRSCWQFSGRGRLPCLLDPLPACDDSRSDDVDCEKYVGYYANRLGQTWCSGSDVRYLGRGISAIRNPARLCARKI